MYKCINCGKTFDNPKDGIDEKGEVFDSCPFCLSFEILEFDDKTQKSDVLYSLLQIICLANNQRDAMKDLGASAQNGDMDNIDGISDTAEKLIRDMYDEFVTRRICNAIKNMRTDNDVDKAYMRLVRDE